jgi:DNA topoisomerase-2
MSLRNLTKERRDEILKDQKEKHDKLEALQKKSPEDLYEDDILNFETEYQKVDLLVFGNFIMKFFILDN